MTKFQPAGWSTVTPRMVTDDVETTQAFLYVYVENADRTHERAIASGAEAIEEPLDTPYGDRRATVRDSWGNTWQIATRNGA